MANIFYDYLDLIEDSFNINDSTLGQSITSKSNWLDKYIKMMEPSDKLVKAIEINDMKRKLDSKAIGLKNKLMAMKIKDDRDLLLRVEDITTLIGKSVGNMDAIGLTKAIRMSEGIVGNLGELSDWVGEYNRFLKSARAMNINTLEVLIELGKAILGRAVELCPIDTGLLRQSGTLLVYSDYIEIVFVAPYATYVHENMENYHPHGRAKFLELALQEFFPNKDVWVELEGEKVVYARISINYDILYKH